jgi:hypothetical protein
MSTFSRIDKFLKRHEIVVNRLKEAVFTYNNRTTWTKNITNGLIVVEMDIDQDMWGINVIMHGTPLLPEFAWGDCIESAMQSWKTAYIKRKSVFVDMLFKNIDPQVPPDVKRKYEIEKETRRIRRRMEEQRENDRRHAEYVLEQAEKELEDIKLKEYYDKYGS